MANKVWNFQLEDGPHTVALEHGYFSGERKVSVDGRPIVLPPDQQRKTFDFGSDIQLNIARHRCAIHIYNNSIAYEYDFSVDGRSVQSGKPMLPLQLPAWGWLFIAACIIMPFVGIFGVFPRGGRSSGALLGVLPGSAAGVCAYVCYMIGRIPNRAEKGRIAICIAITALCWATFFIALTLAR